MHETICYGPSERAWADDEPRINKIVFIGRNLDRKAILEGLRTCVWTPLPDGEQHPARSHAAGAHVQPRDCPLPYAAARPAAAAAGALLPGLRPEGWRPACAASDPRPNPAGRVM